MASLLRYNFNWYNNWYSTKGEVMPEKVARRYQPVSENMRIRHYVMKLLYDNLNHPAPLLSARLLAEKFGISRTTVMTALATLRQEGYLFSHPGKGFFTNPDSRFMDVKPKHLPLVGMVINYGRNFYITRREWEIQTAVGSALLEAGFNLREITLNGLSPEAVLDELAESHVSALAWLLVSDQVSEELLCRINAELFPVVSCTDAFSHPADFRHACNFSLENFPDHESVARAIVEKLNLQLKQRRKETV